MDLVTVRELYRNREEYLDKESDHRGMGAQYP